VNCVTDRDPVPAYLDAMVNNAQGKQMETQPVDFSDLDDLDTAEVTDTKAPTTKAPTTMLEEGANWAKRMGDKMPQQRTKKPGARDVPRDPLRFAPCKKCSGSGLYYGFSSLGRHCFPCNGTGNGLSIDAKAVRARERKVEKAQAAAAAHDARVAAWKAAHPDVMAWFAANPNFEFANSLAGSLQKFGSLTDNQLAAVRKCIEGQKVRDAQRAAERAARVVDVGGEGLAKVLHHFAQARASGLKNPALVFEGVCFKPAKKYPGELYVTGGRAFESAYFGRVNAQGKFDPTRAVTPETLEAIKRIGADPVAEAVAYGKRTGICCCCGRELTNEGSIDAGIGPICAEKWGM
jgi:hypothetical protein